MHGTHYSRLGKEMKRGNCKIYVTDAKAQREVLVHSHQGVTGSELATIYFMKTKREQFEGHEEITRRWKHY